MKKLIIIFLITLFLSSCLIPILKPKEAELLEVKAPLKSPPKKLYALTLKRHTTSSKYPLDLITANKYSSILNSCPIYLHVDSLSNYRKGFLNKLEKKYSLKNRDGKDISYKNINIGGLYSQGYKIKGWPIRFIFVKSYDNPHRIIGTYFHELGHYNCHSKRCERCKRKEFKVNSEYHAMINELEMSIEHDLTIALVFSVNELRTTVDHHKSHKRYAVAGLAIYESTVWNKVETYLHSKGIKTIPKSDHNKNCFISNKCKK